MALLKAPFVSGGYCPGTRTPSSAARARCGCGDMPFWYIFPSSEIGWRRPYSFIALWLRCFEAGVGPSMNHVGAASMIEPGARNIVRQAE
jgi:hypothetical protein